VRLTRVPGEFPVSKDVSNSEYENFAAAMVFEIL
jgi:hypothetical protein